MATSSDTSDQNNVKSRRPAESAFKQQRLPAWQPILTAGTVLPTFFVIGIAFIPVGIGLLYFSDEVKEHVIDYTQCLKQDEAITCADYIKQTNMSMVTKCICQIDFNLTEDFKADVYFYYGLTNFYQNHRRYVKSRDDEQLLGRLERPLSSDCEPFATRQDKPIAPCGAIANSLFNDTLKLYSKDQNKWVSTIRTGIAWTSDKNIKFRNPDLTPFNGSLKAAFANYSKPNNWAVNVWELDLNDPDNNGFQNEDLIVWMRTAALPTFRKLYRRVDHGELGFKTGLGKGAYSLTVEYNYPVTEFHGTKSFVISTTSLLGGKNPFLGVAYIVVGTLCLLLGIVLLIIHVRCSKRYYPTPTESFFLDIDTFPRFKTMNSTVNTKVLSVSSHVIFDKKNSMSNISAIVFPDAPVDNDVITNEKQTGLKSSHPVDESPLYPPDADTDDKTISTHKPQTRFSLSTKQEVQQTDTEKAGVSHDIADHELSSSSKDSPQDKQDAADSTPGTQKPKPDKETPQPTVDSAKKPDETQHDPNQPPPHKKKRRRRRKSSSSVLSVTSSQSEPSKSSSKLSSKK